MQKVFMVFILVAMNCWGAFATDPSDITLEGKIRRLIDERPTDFPPHHPRHKLFAPVIEQFNETSHLPSSTNLKKLAAKAIMAKLKLFKLHNLRLETTQGNALYKHDGVIISTILDYTQSAMDEKVNRKGLNALGVLSDRINTRILMENLPAPEGINDFVEGIWPLLRDHGFVAAGDVTEENIRGVLKLLAEISVK
jgi:hypothetical protein